MTPPTRLERVRALLAERGLDALLLSVGYDLPYLTGYHAMPLERLTMLALTGDTAVLVVPALEVPRVAPRPDFEIRAWEETEDASGVVAGIVAGARSVAIGAQTWSRFLLALQVHLPAATFTDATPLLRELRMRKGPEEVEALAAAGAAVDAIAVEMRGAAWAGRTEAAVAAQVGRASCRERV